MARKREITESNQERQTRIFTEAYSQVEKEITEKHLIKQREPIIVQLEPYFEDAPVNLIFFYDKDSKADLKMLVPRTYTLEEWKQLMEQLISANIITEILPLPTQPVAFAKFTKLLQYNIASPLDSTYEYLIDFYNQEELDKLTYAIENYEIVNYAKKAAYQNELLTLKDSNDIVALRTLQNKIAY